MAEQQPARSRRRVVLDPETPVPLVWGDDERLGRPRIPRTAPVPPAGASTRRPLSARDRIAGTRSPARTYDRAQPHLVRRRAVLRWVVVGLVLVAVVALVGVIVSFVLIQAGLP